MDRDHAPPDVDAVITGTMTITAELRRGLASDRP
jgi:hypothetical protein